MASCACDEKDSCEPKLLSEPLLPNSTPSDKRLKAIVCMNIFALCEVAFGVAWKVASGHAVSVGDCAIARSAIGFLLVQPFLIFSRKGPCTDLPNGAIRLIVLRSMLGCFCFAGVTWSLTMCPLSLYAIIFNTAPFWCSVLGYIVHGETMSKLEIVAMVFCFIGVIGVSFGGTDASQPTNELFPNLTFGVVIAFGTAWVYAGLMVVNRRMPNVHYTVITFYHTMFSTTVWLGIVACYSFVMARHFLVYDMTAWMWIVLTSTFDFLTIITNVVAGQSDKSGFITLVGYIQVFYAFVADIVIFHQTIVGVQLACALAICFITVGIAVHKYRIG